MFIGNLATSFGLVFFHVMIIFWILQKITQKQGINFKHLSAVYVSVAFSNAILISVVNVEKKLALQVLAPVMMTIAYYFLFNFKREIKPT